MQTLKHLLEKNPLQTSLRNPAKTHDSTSTLKTTPHVQQQTTSSQSTGSNISDKRIETLFTRFTAIYGQLWLIAYQNEQVLEFAKREWSESVCDFNNQVLKLALERTKKTNLFPPTLPAFVATCSTIKNELQGRQHTSTFDPGPYEKASPEVVAFNIKQMKTLLNKTNMRKKKC